MWLGIVIDGRKVQLYRVQSHEKARMPVTSELGSSRGMQEPMKESTPRIQESIDNQLIEDISQIKQIALGEGAVVCQVCGSELREGTRVVVYAFRPAGEPMFEIGHVKCADDRHVPTECFTLGVRELVVEGRVGWCSDVATQSSWPVLLEPQALVVNPESTTAAVPRPGVAWFRRPPEECDAVRVVDGGTAGRDSLRPWQRPVVVECDEREGVEDDTAVDCGSGEELSSDREDAGSVLRDGGVSSWSADDADGMGGDR